MLTATILTLVALLPVGSVTILHQLVALAEGALEGNGDHGRSPKDLSHNCCPSFYHDPLPAGWTIREEQFPIGYKGLSAFVDLVATSATTHAGIQVIVVEVKGFRPRFNMSELEKAIGQYLIYKSWVARLYPTWDVYLAIGSHVEGLFDSEPIRAVREDYGIRLIVIDMHQERIISWK